MKTIEETKKIMEALYSDVKGYSLHADEKAKSEEYKDFLYGEATPEVLDDIFKEFEFENGNFYDLGSGKGQLILSASILRNLSKCVGIELLSNMHNVAIKKQAILEAFIEEPERAKIQFINGSFLEEDFSDADLIFASLPSRADDFFDKLEKRFEELKSGTKIVIIIGLLKTDTVEKIKSKKYTFSWGESTAHFYVKK